jgi:hypothetical protein
MRVFGPAPGPVAAVIHHGIDLDACTPGPGTGGYLLFTGRWKMPSQPATAVCPRNRNPGRKETMVPGGIAFPCESLLPGGCHVFR